MKITTWNKLWSLSEKEQAKALERSVSIHPFGRTFRHKEKNRVKKRAEALRT